MPSFWITSKKRIFLDVFSENKILSTQRKYIIRINQTLYLIKSK